MDMLFDKLFWMGRLYALSVHEPKLSVEERAKAFDNPNSKLSREFPRVSETDSVCPQLFRTMTVR